MEMYMYMYMCILYCIITYINMTIYIHISINVNVRMYTYNIDEYRYLTVGWTPQTRRLERWPDSATAMWSQPLTGCLRPDVSWRRPKTVGRPSDIVPRWHAAVVLVADERLTPAAGGCTSHDSHPEIPSHLLWLVSILLWRRNSSQETSRKLSPFRVSDV